MPVAAANNGTVVNASWLGIYGNCVIIDHGLGVQSLYGHLMSFDVKVGDTVTRGQVVGRSDSTGLAGGDHLHFVVVQFFRLDAVERPHFEGRGLQTLRAFQIAR